MIHYDARQAVETGRWYYTLQRGKSVHAVGNCAEDDGHDDPAAARDCYRSWLVEHANFDATADEPRACAVPGCGEPTERLAIPQLGAFYHLCDEHCCPEGLDAVFPPVGSFFTS